MFMKNILITGGAGFIGSHLVRHFVNKYPSYNIFNLDCLTYAGNLHNLNDIKGKNNYQFIYANICDKNKIKSIFQNYHFDIVVHLAAESHVDRSIDNPNIFAETNIIGTINLLNSFKEIWFKNPKDKLFYHVSTDEVYGSLGKTGLFSEESPYSPNSPYSSSKASSDHFVRSYGETYKIPYIISNCSNNYGPNQFPEKLIPLFINNILNNKELPVYGDGKFTRDWLFVLDHVEAIDMLIHNYTENQTYNIGGCNEWKNIDLIKLLCQLMDKKLQRKKNHSLNLIKFVEDRPGHDLRYAIDIKKIKLHFGWSPKYSFKKGLEETIDWYLNNNDWLNKILTGEYIKTSNEFRKK